MLLYPISLSQHEITLLCYFLHLTRGVVNNPGATNASIPFKPNRNLICVMRMVKAAAAVYPETRESDKKIVIIPSLNRLIIIYA